MARVLILTASYGSGHNAAARCLADAFARVRADVHVVDHFRELVSPLFERLSRRLYMAVLRRTPSLWGAAYAIGDWMPTESPLAFGATRLGAAALARLLEHLQPDVVVSVHATPAAAMSALVESGRRLPPHTTVVTDFVAHSQWIARRVDRYCVAAEEVRHEFVARGIPRERIAVTGVPVRADFETPLDPAEARRALGLSDRVPVVLAMAGSFASVGRLPDVARVLVGARRPLQGLVVAGREPALRDKLTALTAGSRVRTLGYVDDPRPLMAAADLLVTKAGGMTLAEALAVGVPMLLYGSLPGQERRNERFASRAGVALVARNRPDLARALDEALRDPDLLEDLRERSARAGRPDAARRVVDVALEGRARRP